jgi:hypothetical protein
MHNRWVVAAQTARVDAGPGLARLVRESECSLSLQQKQSARPIRRERRQASDHFDVMAGAAAFRARTT